MPINAAQRNETKRAFIQEVFVGAGQTATMNTDDIEAAVIAVVTFIESNTVAINNALPEPFKSRTTAAQKRHLVGLVAAKLARIA